MGNIETGKLSQDFAGGLRIGIPATAGRSQPKNEFASIDKTISQQFFIDMILVFYSSYQKLDIKRQGHF